MTKKLKIACFGEVLWDIFPDKKLIGGAPLNVAARIQSLGASSYLISAIGTDALSKVAMDEIEKLHLTTEHIQSNLKTTGQVTVHLNDQGSASYTIEEDVAWDFISINAANKKIAQESHVLIFGSLASRSSTNLETLNTLIDISQYSVFDLNLRAPYYSENLIFDLISKADFIKMNDEELELVLGWLGIHKDRLEEDIIALSRKLNNKDICVTLGAKGAVLYYKGQLVKQDGFPCEIIDTVGAGDSFLAGLIFNLLSGESTEYALRYACALGSIVASKAGANGSIKKQEINNLLN